MDFWLKLNNLLVKAFSSLVIKSYLAKAFASSKDNTSLLVSFIWFNKNKISFLSIEISATLDSNVLHLSSIASLASFILLLILSINIVSLIFFSVSLAAKRRLVLSVMYFLFSKSFCTSGLFLS